MRTNSCVFLLKTNTKMELGKFSSKNILCIWDKNSLQINKERKTTVSPSVSLCLSPVVAMISRVCYFLIWRRQIRFLIFTSRPPISKSSNPFLWKFFFFKFKNLLLRIKTFQPGKMSVQPAVWTKCYWWVNIDRLTKTSSTQASLLLQNPTENVSFIAIALSLSYRLWTLRNSTSWPWWATKTTCLILRFVSLICGVSPWLQPGRFSARRDRQGQTNFFIPWR